MAENRALINPQIVKDSLDAIRTKKGTSEDILVSKMPEEILSIPTGGGVGEDTSALLDAIGVESREDTGMANGLAVALTDSATEQMWSGERSVADGAPIKDGVAFVSALKGKTMKVNEVLNDNNDSWIPYKPSGMSLELKDNEMVCTSLYSGAGNDIIAVCKRNYTLSLTIEHTFLLLTKYASSNASLRPLFENFGKAGSILPMYKAGVNSYYRIYKADKISTVHLLKVDGTKEVGDVWSFSYPRLFDLTEMFGSGNEPTTADEFAQRLGYASINDLPYIPYQETNLQSFAPKAVVSKGRNMLDMSDFENWYQPSSSSVSRKVFKVKPNTKYTLSANVDRGSGSSWCFVVSGNSIDFTPSSANNGVIQLFNYQRVVTTDQQGYLTIGVWREYLSTEEKPLFQLEEGETKTDYTPYIAPSRLDFDLTTIVDADGNQLFPDGELRSAGSVYDVVDYANNVAVKGKKVIGRVDMGSLDWILDGLYFKSSSITLANAPQIATTPFNGVCSEFTILGLTPLSSTTEKCIAMASVKKLWVRDSRYTSSSAFKSAMQGVYLYFELATPIDGEAPITKSFYPVQSNGSEEAITESIVPFNGEIRYRGESESLLTQSASLLRYSNEVTGANDSSLGNAVKTLTDSYK